MRGAEAHPLAHIPRDFLFFHSCINENIQNSVTLSYDTFARDKAGLASFFDSFG